MKKLKTLSIAFFTTAMLSFSVSNAAIPIRQQAAATEQLSATTNSEMAPTVEQQAQVRMATKQQMTKKAASSSSMPAILYIILAIIGFGWLAMGINDNFGDFDWLISLVLYILFYIPGLIYTLVKMSKYY